MHVGLVGAGIPSGDSWTKAPREFGEIRTAAWLP